MKYILPYLITIILSIAVQSQDIIITGKVLDSIEMKTLAHANIMILTHRLGTTSDENGAFNLPIPSTLVKDTIIVSYVGYQPKHICISDIKEEPILLNKQVVELNEVLVHPDNGPGRNKKIIVNRFVKRKSFTQYEAGDETGEYWIPSSIKEPSIQAIYIPFQDSYNNKSIKEVRICLTSFSQSSIYRLRVIKPGEMKMPDSDMLTEALELKAVLGEHIVKVNLEEFSLSIPDNGIYIGVELLLIPENLHVIHYNDEPIHIYSPFINVVRSNEPGRYWVYSRGKWVESNKEFPGRPNIGNSYSMPAISLVLE